MSSRVSKFLKKWSARQASVRRAQRSRSAFAIEPMESRLLLSVSAVFSPVTDVLMVLGDNQNNTIEISSDAGGNILLNGGDVPILGGTPTVANTVLIQVVGQAGDDSIVLNEANGALPRVNLFGGSGDDLLVGGSAADLLFGQAGNDNLQSRGGDDLLAGGAGNDGLIGGDGNDLAFGQAGDDFTVWRPGDDTDLNEGGSGFDTVEVIGADVAEAFTVSANGGRVHFDRVDPAPFALDIGSSEELIVSARGGDDSLSTTGNLAALIQISVNGGEGNDILLGSNGADLLVGGSGNDVIDGNGGSDVAFLGDGDDIFQWDPGDGSDSVEGQDGIDTLTFNGSSIAESINISANGERVLFTRDLGSITMDLNDIEQIDFNALGGADNITVNDLSGTDAEIIRLNLAAGGGGDGEVDTVTVNGTDADDIIDIMGQDSTYAVLGLPAVVGVLNSESTDLLIVNARAGDDSVSSTTLPAATVRLAVDGGSGNDTITGGPGNELLLGGDGKDFVDGNQGNDTAALGADDDIFVWDPGDGSDLVEGQDGGDFLLFNGSNANENISIVANGTRVRLVRDVGGITMDLNGLEQIEIQALGGTDAILLGDLSGTGITDVNLALAGVLNGGMADGQADSIVVTGTDAGDNVLVNRVDSTVTVTGLAAAVHITHAEQGDQLFINTQAGADVVDASPLGADGIRLQINGGAGADTLIGSQDDDVFVWNPGDGSDVVEGQDGVDLLVFNGSNANENIGIVANGTRASLIRDVGGITMDLNELERIEVQALGGADLILVGDLSGTGIAEVNVALADVLNGSMGDGQTDSVVVTGTAAADAVLVTREDSTVTVTGLAAAVNITHAENADKLFINTQAGADVVDASALEAGAINLTINGGAGADNLIGSQGNDVFVWNPGDASDVVEGQDGIDRLLFNGNDANENFSISANGERVQLTRDAGNVTMDLNDVEQADVNAFGGVDMVTVNDLGGTDLTDVNLDLAAFGGAGDAQPDTVIINSTDGDDGVFVNGDGSGVTAFGPAASVNIKGAETANDRLVVNTLAGNDVFDATDLSAASIQLTVNGGDGDDIIVGGQGNDVLLGGAGDDFLIGGDGVDVVDGEDGDDIEIQ